MAARTFRLILGDASALSEPLEVQPLRSPIPRTQIESETFAQPEGSGLKTPAGSRCNQVSAAALEGFTKVLREHDPSAAARFDGWIAGRGDYPQRLDLEELRWSDWDPPTTVSPEELRLSKQIAAHLVSTKNFRYVTPEELRKPGRRRDKFGCSFEHSIRDLAGTGRVDVLLADRRSAKPTLLAIEVKIRASLAPSRNPVRRSSATARRSPLNTGMADQDPGRR